MAATPKEGLLLYDQYEFHSIDRMKIRYGRPYYLVKWKKPSHSLDVTINSSNEELEPEQTESRIAFESVDTIEDPDVPTVLVDDGGYFLVTKEITELVQSAFPKAVENFLQEKQLKKTKSTPIKSKNPKEDSKSPISSGVQLSITEFYRSTKPVVREFQTKDEQKNSWVEESPNMSRKLKAEESTSKIRSSSANLDQEIPKSVRRRLLFD